MQYILAFNRIREVLIRAKVSLNKLCDASNVYLMHLFIFMNDQSKKIQEKISSGLGLQRKE